MVYHVWIEDNATICNDRFGRDIPKDVSFFRAETMLDMYNLMELASVAMQKQRAFYEMSLPDVEKRVDELIAEKEVLQSVVNRQAGTIASFTLSLQGARSIIEHAFSAIARDLVLDSTHRARNELYRAIARILDNWLCQAHDTSDMDDIPF